MSIKTKTTDNPWKVFFVNIDGDPLCKPIYRWIHDKQCNSKLLYFAALDTTLVDKTVFDIYNENAKKLTLKDMSIILMMMLLDIHVLTQY